MANLIITIIAIALVAVMALAGMWYGGDTFSSSQAKANALKLILATDQIAAAWQAYALDRGGDYTLPVSANGLNTVLVPNYLSSAISFPDLADQNSGRPNQMQITISGNASGVADSNSVRFYSISPEVCAQINLILQGTTQIDLNPTFPTRYEKSSTGFCFANALNTQWFYAKRVFQ